MTVRKLRSLAAVTITTVALATAAVFASPASADSAPCTQGTAPIVVGGARVSATLPTGNYPSGCLRVRSVSRTGNTIWISTSLRDTAHDGQLAAGMVRLYLSNGTYSTWQNVQPRSAVEAFVNGPMQGWSMPDQSLIPVGVQFAACRATSQTSPTNACGFSPTYPV